MPEQYLIDEAIEEFKKVNLMDDGYARIFFDGNIRDIQLILRVIMDKPDLVVKSVSVQEEFFGPDDSHSVVFDVYAVDSEDRQYDIEFQNLSEGASPYRADYNSAMMTVNTLKKKRPYSELAKHERVVIFITKHDVMKGKLPLYTVKRVVLETGEHFNDGTSIIYVNTAYKNYTSALGKLIHDFRCGKAEEFYYHELADTAGHIVRKGGRFMKVLDKIEAIARAEGKAQGEAIGEAKGEAKAQESIATSLIRLGKLALEDIANVCHLTLEQVKNLAATVNA